MIVTHPKKNSPEAATPVAAPRLQRLDALTGARFLAALYVVLYHSARIPLLPVPVLGSMIQSAAACMSFFFVLSGFVLGYSSYGRSVTAKEFYISRVSRIYPIYTIALVLALPRFGKDLLDTGNWIDGLGAIITAPFLMHSWLPGTATFWNAPGWSVSVEAFFYLMFPICLYWFAYNKTRTLLLTLAGLWVVGILPAVLYWQVNPDGLTDMSVAAHESFSHLEAEAWLGILLHNPLLHLCEFLAGIVLSRIFHLNRDHAGRISNWLFVPATGLLIAACTWGLAIPYPLFHNGLLVPLFLILVYCLAAPPAIIGAVLGSRLFVILGEASYPIYILQHPISTLFKSGWYLATGTLIVGNYTSWMALGLYTGLLIAISVVLSSWVDPPLRRHAKEFVSKRVRFWIHADRTTESLGRVNSAS